MNLTLMSYKDCVWPCNPETLRIERRRSIAEFAVPGGTGAVQDNGSSPLRVSGSGRFCGSGAQEEFARLAAVFAQGGSGTLRLPGESPFQAVFSSLTMKGVPRPGCVEYDFLFQEDVSASAAVSQTAQTHLCADGETLWDVANAAGVSVDALLAANPQIEWPNALAAGEEILIP